MHPEAQHLLKNVFGYESFRGHQEAIITRLVEGGDALVLMPTGGGKSLCYQIPALMREGVAGVFSPLIALMEDQVAALDELGIPAAALNSSQRADQQRTTAEHLRQGKIKLLYMAPERLMQPRMLGFLQQIPVALFAIDEAHCVSQWGHDFRPEYLQLGRLAELFPQVPRMALTATADQRTREEIVQRLHLEQAASFLSSFNRPNIFYRIVLKDRPRQQLLGFLEGHRGESGIVYCLSRRKVEEVAGFLVTQGFTALPYHAGLSAEQRSLHQRRFLNEEGLIMVATIAFGMGIDKPNVRFVVHLDLPRSLEAYYQETGRAGRDGLPAEAWMAYGLQDVLLLKQLLAQSEGDERHKRVEQHKLEAMLALCEETRCRRQALLAYFDELLPEPCGCCDVCLDGVETWDATEPARQALSAIYRTGQRYGVGYLIDVLLGRDNTRVRTLGHQQLSVFGLGHALTEADWRSVFRQLIARGLVGVDLEGHGGLHLLPSCRALLRGEARLQLRRDPRQISSTPLRSSTVAHLGIAPQDQALWERLRATRRRLAEEHSVPPYVIFPDATLLDMLRKKPSNLQELAGITGVGSRKLERYGALFLAVLQGETAVVDLAHEVVQGVRAGLSAEQIAAQLHCSMAQVYALLGKAITDQQVTLEQVFSLPDELLGEIYDRFLSVEEDLPLASVIYEQMAHQIPLGVLQCVRAALLIEFGD